MLQALHKSAGNWIVKIFLVLIAASFAVWGVGDIFRDQTESVVAWVGDKEISRTELSQSFRRELNSLQRALRTHIDSEQARSLGLVDRSLDNLISNKLFVLEANRLGLAASDSHAVQEIRQNNGFKDVTGKFDRFRFDTFLRQLGMGEEQFIALIRDDILRRQLGQTIVTAVSAPNVLVDTLYRYRKESRIVEFAVINNADMKIRGDASEADLAKQYEDNPRFYTAPEYRKLTFLHIAPEDLADEVTVEEDEIRADYEDRQASFVTPERRTVEQIVSNTETDARATYESLSEGTEFAAAAKEKGLSAEDISLGTMIHGDFFDKALADAVFDLEEGQFSTPVQTGLGWHIVRVTGIVAGSTRSFEDVREDLERELILQKAADGIYPLANDLEDLLAGGATLEESANRLEIRIATIDAIDVHGKSPSGEADSQMPAEPEFLSKAFELALGEESILTETSAGTSFIVRVDEITASAVKPFDQVRDQVVEDWGRSERDKAAAAVAERMVKSLDGGEKFSGVAARENVDIQTSDDFERGGSGAAGSFSRELVDAAFALGSGESAAAPNANGNGHIVIRLKGVSMPVVGNDQAGVDTTRQELNDAFSVDIGSQYRSYLEDRFPVEIDQDAVNNLF